MYCSTESGVSYYLDAFVTTELGSAEHAANILSLFWLLMIAGRIVGGMLYRYRRQMMYTCLFATGLSLTVLMAFPSLGLAYICFSLTAFFLAPVWSHFMSMATERYPGNSAAATGIMSTGAGIGAVTSPLFLGALMDSVGLRAGFCCIGGLAVVGMWICRMYYKKISQKSA